MCKKVFYILFVFSLLFIFSCSYSTRTKLPSDVNEIKLDLKKIKESQEKSVLLLETDNSKRDQNINAQFDSLKNSLISMKQELERTQDEVKLLRGKIEEYQYNIAQKEAYSSPSSLQGEIKARRPAPTTIKTPIPPAEENKTTGTAQIIDPNMSLPTPVSLQPTFPQQQTPENISAEPTTPQAYTQPAIVPMPSNEEVELNLQSARNFFSAAKYELAISTIDSFMVRYKDFPKVPDYLFLLGQSYFYKDDLENAKKTFEKIYFEHKVSSSAPESLAFLSAIAQKNNEKDKAIFYYEKILSDYPSYSEIGRIKEELKILKQDE